MKFRYIRLLALLPITLAIAPFAVQAQGQSTTLVLEADAAAFKLDSVQDRIEVYYAVLQRGLKFEEKNGAWEAPFDARVELWRSGHVIDQRSITQTIRYQVTKQQLDSISANKLIGMTAFAVKPGEKTVAAFIWNRGSVTAADTIRSEPLELPAVQTSKIALSGVEFGSSLQKNDGSTNPFEKVGYILTPNPSSVYGENYTKLFYYTELYVPKALVGSDPVTLTTRIVDAAGRQLLASSQEQQLTSEAIPLIVGLDIDGLPQDQYRLQVQIKQDGGVIAERQKPFFYLSGMQIVEEQGTPAAASSQDLFAISPFSRMTEAEADELIAQSLYLGSDAERKQAKAMKTLDAKRHFLLDFWMRRDPEGADPLTTFGEYRARLQYVAEKYSYQRTPGWKTSRGRIFLIYGQPRAIGGEEFNPETKPYITWSYDPVPGVRVNSGSEPTFVFVDRQGGGNFVLVHSNVIGEVNEPDWYNVEAHRLAH
jgi:GWxTD domain-containing protein